MDELVEKVEQTAEAAEVPDIVEEHWPLIQRNQYASDPKNTLRAAMVVVRKRKKTTRKREREEEYPSPPAALNIHAWLSARLLEPHSGTQLDRLQKRVSASGAFLMSLYRAYMFSTLGDASAPEKARKLGSKGDSDAAAASSSVLSQARKLYKLLIEHRLYRLRFLCLTSKDVKDFFKRDAAIVFRICRDPEQMAFWSPPEQAPPTPLTLQWFIEPFN